jgi:transposase
LIARRGVAHGSGLGKVRWVLERAFAWLHQFKRLRIRGIQVGDDEIAVLPVTRHRFHGDWNYTSTLSIHWTRRRPTARRTRRRRASPSPHGGFAAGS